jgi:hypothetical protein
MKKSIYVSTYKQDYIWHKINIEIKLKQQKETCKRLSIPKYIREKYKRCKKNLYKTKNNICNSLFFIK